MKRTISKLLGMASFALLSLGLLAGTATAAPLRTSTNGGITCGEYTRGAAFPATYWDCITPLTNTSNAASAANAALSLPTTVKNQLASQNTQIFLFASNADYVSYTGGAVSTGVFGAIRGPMTLPGYSDVIQMAAIYKTVTIAGTATAMNSYYAANIKQQLGRIYAPSAVIGLKPTDAFFTAALRDDFLTLSNNTGVDKPDYPSSATVWGSTIASAYPGKSPWEILSLRYGATYTDKTYLYGLQVGRQGSNTEPALSTFLQSYMRTTREWTSQQFYGVNPQPYQVVNGVLCVQFNGDNVYPLTWWSCVQAYTPSTAHQAVEAFPNSNVPEIAGPPPVKWQTLLKNAGIQVYSMRNIDDFVSIAGGTPGGLNILGISTYGANGKSAAFQDTFTSYSAGPPILYNYKDEPQFMSGTILHELGHQFDQTIWNNISTANSAAVLGSIRWQNAVTADITAFNALPCATAIDLDRTANSLPTICGAKPAGTSNFSWLGSNGLIGSTTNKELWARAFNRRIGGTQPGYAFAVQVRLGANMQAYMNDLWTTGAPHN